MNIRYRIAIFVVVLGVSAPSLGAGSPTAEDKLIDVLKSGAGVAEKANACRELKLAGTEKSIPVLASFLADAELSHPARYALESMPYPAAGAALREALGKATGLARSGIIDSLGQRRDAAAIELIVPDLVSKDIVLVAAAATALGKIGTWRAVEPLHIAYVAAKGEARVKIGQGLLLGIDRLRQQAADNFIPHTLYSSLRDPRLVKGAALSGVMRTAGPQALIVIDVALANPDPMVRAAAAGELHSLSDAGLSFIASHLGELPETSQVAVLAAMRIRGKEIFAPAALAAAKSRHESVRLAAARTLGIVGDVTALPALVELAAAEGPVGQTARESLQAIYGPKIDEQIFAALKAEKDPARRAAWIGVLQSRQPTGVVPLLLDEVSGQGPVVATRALAALGKLAKPKDIPALVAVVLKTENGPVREEAGRAVRQVCLQIADVKKRAQPVLSIFHAASPTERLALLPLLGSIGGDDVRAVVQDSLGSKDPAVYETAVRAISNWPDASAAGQLLGLAQSAKEPAHRQWALHAFVRVVSLPGGASNTEKLANLKQAMLLSQTDEQRLWVIQRAAAVRAVETLRFVAPYVEQPAFAEQACRSVVELAHHKELRNPNLPEFTAALQKVLATSKDAATLDRAKRYLEGN